MVTLADHNLCYIKDFLEELLPKFTKVDAGDLTKLILALLVKKGTRDEIKKECITELNLFFPQDLHMIIVNKLFDKIAELEDGARRAWSIPSKPGEGIVEIVKDISDLDEVIFSDYPYAPKQEKPKGKRAKRSSGKSVERRRGTKRSRGKKKGGRKHSRRRRRSSSSEFSAEEILSKSELRNFMRNAVDRDERKQILNRPKLLKSYHNEMNSKAHSYYKTRNDRCLQDLSSKPLFEHPPLQCTVISSDFKSRIPLQKYSLRSDVDPPEINSVDSTRRRPVDIDSTQKHHKDRRNVLVADIPALKNTIPCLNEFFSKFGCIQNLQVHAGKNKAFIQFSSVFEARRCVRECKKRIVMDDSRIIVDLSSNIESNKSKIPGLKCGGAGVGVGVRKVVNYNHDPVSKVFGHEYVSMDRPTSGLYTKDVRKQRAKEADRSDSTRKSDSITTWSELVNPSKITSPRASSPKISKSTSTLQSPKQRLKPIALPKTTISSKLFVPMTAALDKQIEVCKAQRDKQLEMWEQLTKMKGTESKAFCAELGKRVKELNDKVLLLMRKKKKSVIKRVVSSWTPPSRSVSTSSRGRARRRGRGYNRWRGRGKWNRGRDFGAGQYMTPRQHFKKFSKTLQIEELPSTVDEVDLRAHFSQYGEVTSVDVIDGTGKVAFSTKEEAEQAITRGRIFQGLFEGEIILKITHVR